MFDNEMTNEGHEPFSRAVSPSCFSQLSNKTRSSRRSSPSHERRNINSTDLKSTILQALQLSNPQERIDI